MKPIHIIAGLGATAVVALAGWYMYMSQTPTYERTYDRSLPPGVAAAGGGEKPAEPAKAAEPAEPAKAEAPAEPAAPADGAAPAEAAEVAAPPADDAPPAEPAAE